MRKTRTPLTFGKITRLQINAHGHYVNVLSNYRREEFKSKIAESIYMRIPCIDRGSDIFIRSLRKTRTPLTFGKITRLQIDAHGHYVNVLSKRLPHKRQTKHKTKQNHLVPIGYCGFSVVECRATIKNSFIHYVVTQNY